MLGTDPGHSEKHLLSYGRTHLNAAHGLIKSMDWELSKRRELSEGVGGNGEGGWELPMLPNPFKLTGTGLTAGAARQGSASGNRPKSTLPKTCSVFA